jgi:hypothetical protein
MYNVSTANIDARYGGIIALTQIHCSLYHTSQQRTRKDYKHKLGVLQKRHSHNRLEMKVSQSPFPSTNGGLPFVYPPSKSYTTFGT